MEFNNQEFTQSRQTLKDEIKNEMELRKAKDKIYSRLTAQMKKTEKAESTAQKEREKLDILIKEHNALSNITKDENIK
ncbi:hypothetical protein KDE13_09290 [Campylobacter sp. faydin G-140]|uniref:hypothetical protein n=1 Tax=Campylobacter anatolicus TaxID=2829105 RepID=UPI001B8E13A7|nr:hypothetical protein [Campylobacter anatolicus]MBR8466527.1 hypothetical protein [Campylobacter anatolicus]